MDKLLEETKYLMKKYKIKANKSLGQNFLIDEKVIEDIVDGANIDNEDLVIEIGPGLGSMTKLLLEKAKKVICIELDKKMIKILNDRFIAYHNLEIINDDVLKLDLNKIISKEKDNIKNVKIVANLPYYITTPIIMKIVNSNLNFKKICMMVQKEVGNRFCASPGSREYGSISVFLSYFYDVKKEFLVSRKEFVPEPNVDSVVISFTKKDVVLNLKDRDLFFKVVRDSFQFKRKNLRNNLKKYDLNIIRSVLQDYDYDLTVRAEQLSVEIFVAIANALAG